MPKPEMNRAANARLEIGCVVGYYTAKVTDHWLLTAPSANPSMLEMFRDRDAQPYRQMVPWAGEFAGKYLTSAVEILRVTRDRRLRDWIKAFVARLITLQADDGYLGPWPKKHRLANYSPNGGDTWDTWGHYHMMLGLMLWHDESRDQAAQRAAVRIADLLCKTFLGKSGKLVATGCSEMNLAPVHSLAKLYRKTGTQRYLDLALQLVDEFAGTEAKRRDLRDSRKSIPATRAGDYFRAALKGKEFYEMPKPRWESLHPIMGLAELYWATGDETYRTAFEHHWWSIVAHDRHNGGGFTSGERATGNPYDPGAIESCCTIAWMAMSVEMLKMTGNSIVADELELSMLNSVIGMHSPTGRWSTYNTPMNGVRRASAHTIVFQARQGSPELNCCSVNAPRGFGILSEWAMMKDRKGLILNWYGASRFTVPVARGTKVAIEQTTDYPHSGRIAMCVTPSRATEFTIKLRIPHWSAKTRVRVNGETVGGVKAGTYLVIDRRWRRGDTIELTLDMSLHFWRGQRDCKGQSSIYRGPILLTYDHRYNLEHEHLNPRCKDYFIDAARSADADLSPPSLDAKSLRCRPVKWRDPHPPALLFRVKAANGKEVHLCDFGSAGETGTPYHSWLPVKNAPRTPKFSRSNPLRTAR
jgi:DUF1680 family protein